MTYGVFSLTPARSWPMKEPAAYLDYSWDASAEVGADTLTSVSVAIQPGGEVIPSNLTVAANVVTVWLAGGIAGRRYVVSISGATATRTYQWTIGLVCDPALAVWPLEAPVVPGFGAAVVWTDAEGYADEDYFAGEYA